MELMDWLTLDLSELATENPAICAKNKQKIARIATVAGEIAKPAILQVVDSESKNSRNSKNSKNSSSNAPELKKAGLKRLEAAAAGLPISLAELALIFADDMEDFGTGAVSMAGIRQACEWCARNRPPLIQWEEEPAGMVRCTECQQDNCPHERVTPWGSVERQSSTQWRWCSEYTAQVHQITDYRRR